jgi:hypothetical protein
MADVHGAKRTMLVHVDAFTSAPMAKAQRIAQTRAG